MRLCLAPRRTARSDRRPVRCWLSDRKGAGARHILATDEGIATGYTTRAAIAALRRADASELVLAVPVAPAEVVAALEPLVDRMVCLYAPDILGLVPFSCEERIL